ncbi:MAG: 6-hydroxymethylpterin diphosphokinase MptE-like protein [Nitrospirota bacterium]
MNIKNSVKEEDNYHELIDLNEFIPIQRPKKVCIQQDIYENNIAALERHNPELIELIESTIIEENRIKVLYSENGDPRILYRTEDNKEIYIHNAEDPTKCANQAIDLLGKMEKDGIVILFGFGLGYFAEEILKRFEKGHFLMIYEATPAIFKTALQMRDITDLLKSEKVKIVLGEDMDDFSVVHSHHHLIVNGKFWIVQHQPSIKLNENAYNNFFKRLNEEKSLSDTGIATTIGRGKEFVNAFLMNVPSIIKKPGVSKLKDIFKGHPAIIVSAGPSLDKNLHLLKKAKGKAVIIAVDGAIPTLLSCNIFPDIVVAIDPVVDNIADKFKDIPLLKDVPFVCLSQYTPEAVQMYPGPIFLNSGCNNIAYQWLSGFWEDKGYIECFGGSVAHLAFNTAEFIGAEIIAFAGQDLSYSGERVHTRGYSDRLDISVEEAFEKGLKDIPGSIPVVDIFNEKVLTISQFLIFKTSFEKRIREIKIKVVNATEAGLPIEGAVNMRLIDFIDEYCSNQPQMDTSSILSGISDNIEDCNLDGLISEVTTARYKFREIRKVSEKILKHTKKLKTLKKKGQKDSIESHNILKKIQPLIEEVKHPILNLVAGYHYGLELYLKKQDVQEIDEIEDKWERLDKQLERGQIYYSEVIKAISLFNKQLDKLITALQREKKVDSILSDESIEEKERFIRVGLIYKKAGMIAQAARYLEAGCRVQGAGCKVQKEDYKEQGLSVTNDISQFTDTHISLAEIYIKQFRFYEARELLKGGRRQKAEGRRQNLRIIKLVKICNEKIKAWDERKKEMKRLLKDAEANYGSHLESGYFYFRIKDYERAEKAYLKSVSGQESGGRNQESGAYYGLAHTYLARDEAEEAINALEKAIMADPDNPIFYRDLGIISIQNSDVDSAEIFFKKAIELAPNAEELYKLLTDIYINQGEIEKGISLYENAILANPDNPQFSSILATLYREMIRKRGRSANPAISF